MSAFLTDFVRLEQLDWIKLYLYYRVNMYCIWKRIGSHVNDILEDLEWRPLDIRRQQGSLVVPNVTQWSDLMSLVTISYTKHLYISNHKTMEDVYKTIGVTLPQNGFPVNDSKVDFWLCCHFLLPFYQ